MPEIGQTISHYRITGNLGKGGMGEVFLADDMTLDRKVALKFLPDAFTSDPERMARFEREAKLLASLNHPNIAGIYGLEQADGNRFLVLEYVEGETLQARLSKGALPLEEALAVCHQIAEGLEAAHEKGVIHRDLKPANVMFTAEEKVKILDFGLAKALADEIQSISLSQSPTITEAMTQPGVILGTAAYMSPEQAKGKSVDKRADIWAFGCILYECLTGKKAFEGETVTEALAAILRGEPDWEALPATTSQNIRFVLRRCLEKERNRRFRDAADVQIQIDEIRNLEEIIAPFKYKHPWIAWSICLILFIALISLAFLYTSERRSDFSKLIRYPLDFRHSVNVGNTGTLALSPDGRHFVFPGLGQDGTYQFWIHSFDSINPRLLPGSQTRNYYAQSFWSSDSRYVAFDAGGELKKIDITNGTTNSICKLSGVVTGGSWNDDDVIIFGDRQGTNGIVKVSATGGSALSTVTKPNPERGEISHGYPVFLPDGRHFFYLCESSIQENTGLYIGSLDLKTEEQDTNRLIPITVQALYAPLKNSDQGNLVYLQGDNLVARPFNHKKLELSGDGTTIAEDVGSTWYYGFFTVSPDGVLVYRESIANQPTWIDRNGRELNRLEHRGDYGTFDLSIDGNWLVASNTNTDGFQNLWVIDLLRGTNPLLTKGSINQTDPRWSPDGKQVMFGSQGDSDNALYRETWPSSNNPQQFYKMDNIGCYLDDWSPDGNYILYHNEVKSELNALHIKEKKPIKIASALSGTIDQSQFSPDGQWIAYNTDESGRQEVKVVPFLPNDNGGARQISSAGGVQPRWSEDGRELYFLALDGSLMAVKIHPDKQFDFDEPTLLFNSQLAPTYGTEQYVPHPDGERFLFMKPATDSKALVFNVIHNWNSQLDQ